MNAAIRGEPSEVYHATDAISHSKLEVFRRRPALYHRKYVLKGLRTVEEARDIPAEPVNVTPRGLGDNL